MPIQRKILYNSFQSHKKVITISQKPSYFSARGGLGTDGNGDLIPNELESYAYVLIHNDL